MYRYNSKVLKIGRKQKKLTHCIGKKTDNPLIFVNKTYLYARNLKKKMNPFFKKTSIFLLLLCCLSFSGASLWAQVENDSIPKTTPELLILGDSHLVGDFGEYLHKQLHKINRFDITSIAIGGAGSMHFTLTMKNFCCGYKIRVSKKDEIIPDKSKIRTLEHVRIYTNEIVFKSYEGRLANYIKASQPAYVLIALGSNLTNAHQNLVEIIRGQSPQTQIIWVGPFKRERFNERIDPIIKVTSKYKIPLIRSDDIVGNDTLKTAHFYGRTASNWAIKIGERLKPHLNTGT